ncbi:MAG: T9SS type A sorting domain-containing protein [Flavobacteriaceae bacterium]|nr:T9SS type A sorting domain-containing protein [Flavobacteriaceae bacterium]
MKILCSFFAFSWVFMTNAQTELRKQSIDSGGALTQSGTVTMLFTVGEVVVAEGVSGTYSISEGFIGKDMNIALNLDEFDELIGVSIYPNPFVSELNITFPNSSQYDIELYDVNGKLIWSRNTSNQTETKLVLDTLSETNYFLLVKDVALQKVKVFQVIKQ